MTVHGMLDELDNYQRAAKRLLETYQWPEEGWPTSWILHFMQEFSRLDSNNAAQSIGVGEREGRVLSSLVSMRNFGFSHGIGIKIILNVLMNR